MLQLRIEFRVIKIAWIKYFIKKLDHLLYRNDTLHAPSTETMHGPIGLSGVQTFPKSGHFFDSNFPRMTSPHRHPGGSIE